MNTISTGSKIPDAILYTMTLIGTTLTENWYLIGMFAFGAVHAFVAYKKYVMEKEMHKVRLQKINEE